VAEAVQADCSTALARRWQNNGHRTGRRRALLAKHVRLSADRRGRRPAAVTSVHSSARYRISTVVSSAITSGHIQKTPWTAAF